ncbi:hypothetical protein [Marinibactrum halimedae]|uniref:Uncharacterized protein n=1 Tax=Marinibactrum halimedae TaxID=1444977 RepID=A0AA37T8K6_9GAMM|nr:hypothetical protein [Marinibactrum halimedae]MCD9458989.1 hypothetical protein [Marinibactrum halimedae]GLS26882.1 hypothetical protein GCM10007877_26010 [Marinibactrum halimedae]
MQPKNTVNTQRLLILLLLVAYVFSPTVFNWMVSPNGVWYRPFLVWLLVIVIAYLFQGRSQNGQ